MSLNSMARRLSLEVPGLPDGYAITLLGESLSFIEDSQLWSFQLKEAGWLTPGLLFPAGPGTSSGTIKAVVGSNLIVGSPAAAAQWAAYVGPPLLTACQIRSPFYSLYNIVGYNGTNTFTLDRPWMEPSGNALAYMIYQAYFPVPVSDFRRFISIRDTTNNCNLDYWSLSQKDLAVMDAERTVFDEPSYVVPYEVDNRPNTSTPGQMLYELWPQPLDQLPYTFNYIRRGPSLQVPADTAPYPITEEMILWQAKVAAYLWKEAQKGENIERGSGADYKFLAQAAEKEYLLKAKPIKDKDRDMVELYFNRTQNAYRLSEDGYANINGTLNVGRF